MKLTPVALVLTALVSMPSFADILCLNKSADYVPLAQRDSIELSVYKNVAGVNAGKPILKVNLTQQDGDIDGPFMAHYFSNADESVTANFKVPRDAQTGAAVGHATLVTFNGKNLSLKWDQRSSTYIDAECFTTKTIR